MNKTDAVMEEGCAVERFSGRHPAARQRERLTCDRLEDIAFLACLLIVGVVW